jgi:hypothetical protein
LKSDEELRLKVRTYQSLPFETLELPEVEDFVDALRKIETKLPYLVRTNTFLYRFCLV